MLKSAGVACSGMLSLLYLLNIGLGIVEVVPDNIPFIGNLDEGTAAASLLMCLRYFGVDLTRFFSRPASQPRG